MRTVSFLKLLDFILQLCALFIPIICAVAEKEYFYLFFCYLAVGTVQVISCVLNALALDKFYRNRTRRAYEYILLGIGAFTLIAILSKNHHQASDILVPFFCALAFLVPFLEVWYMLFSYKEMMFIRSVVNRKQYI